MAKTKRSHSISMLFIGNSFTQRNNLPALLAEMAARDLCVKHEMIGAGGASLRTHWNEVPGVGASRQRFRRPNSRVAILGGTRLAQLQKGVFPFRAGGRLLTVDTR